MNQGLPRHVGIIMDGNGRWAQKRGLPRLAGHKAGVQAFERICNAAAAMGLPALTVYAFSTENWARPPAEVAGLMALFRHQLQEMERRRSENEAKGFCVRYIGALTDGSLPPDILELLQRMQDQSRNQTRTVVNIALNYGGQQEILAATQRLCTLAQSGALQPEQLTLAHIEAELYTAGLPPLDLIIRPSGELRLSNFMLWQSAYAELWFSNILWPDFSVADFKRALQAYAGRNRRFGRVDASHPKGRES